MSQLECNDELGFLLKAANFGATDVGSFSAPARDAVNLQAERMKIILEMQLKVAKAQLELVDPIARAKELHARGAGVG
jgi:hypothetical protein